MVDQEELLMREVDEDVRRDKFDEAWQKYKGIIIGTAVSIVLVVAANTFWKDHVRTKRDAASDAYTAALVKAESEGADVSSVWSESRSELSEAYIELSYLQEAAALFKADKFDEALITYDILANNTDADTRFRELAQLLASRIEFKQGKYGKARGRLFTLSSEDNLWTYSAQETLALIDIAEGNINDAVSKLSKIALSPSAPTAMQKRAEELKQLLEQQMTEELQDMASTSVEETPEVATPNDVQEESKE